MRTFWKISTLLVSLAVICSQFGTSVSQDAAEITPAAAEITPAAAEITPATAEELTPDIATIALASGSASGGKATASATASVCICPKQGALPYAVHHPECALENVNRLWNQTSPKLSKRALAFKEVILDLAKSDVPRWRNIATAVSGWFWSSVGEVSCKPNFCGFTKVINASYTEEIDCEALKCGLNMISSTVMDATKYITATSLRNAGCPTESNVLKPSVPECYAHGSKYPIKQFWQKYGPCLPCAYETAVKRLYCSKCYTNQLLASIATAGATEAMVAHYKNFDKKLTFTALKLLTPKKIPLCCCPMLKTELANSMSCAGDSADVSAKMTLKDVGCPA